MTPQTSSTNFSRTHSWAVQSWKTKTNEAASPELSPAVFWSPKSSSFSGSDSIVVEEAARNFRSSRPSINKSRALNFSIQHDKVEASKLRRYLETCGRAFEQFVQRQTSSNDSIVFLLGMPLDRLVRGSASLREHAQQIYLTPPWLRSIAETNRHAIYSILVYRT